MNNKNNNKKIKYNEVDVIQHLKFIDVVKTLSDGVIVIDDKRNIIYASSNANTIFGYTSDELIGKSHDILVPMQSKEKHRNNCIHYFLKPKTMPIGGIHKELKGLRKNGTEFYIDVGISPVNTERGLLAISIVRDISEYKKAQDKLMESEKRMKSTLDSMLEGCQIIGYDWRYLYVNDAITKQGRKTKEVLLGRTMMEVYPGIENTEMFLYLRRCMEERTSHHMENEFTFPDGFKSWFELSIQPVPEGIFILSININERKKYEKALENKKQELIYQNKLTSDFLNILEITATSLNFHEALNKIMPFICNLMESNNCVAYCLDAREETLQPSHQLNLSKDSLAYFMSSAITLCQYKTFMMNHRVNFLQNTKPFISHLPEQVRDLLKTTNTKSFLMIPITYEGEIQSLLIITYSKNKIFNGKKKELANKLQKHLESSFMAHRHSLNLLYKTMNSTQQLEMSEAMSSIDRSILTSTTEEEIIYGTIKLFGKVLPIEIIEILKFNAERKCFVLIASYEKDRIRINIDETLKTDALKSFMSIKFGIPAYYSNLPGENIIEPYEKGFFNRDYKSLLVIPLLSKGDLTGLISIGNSKAAAYSPDHLLIAQRLGNQIAVALSNTELIKQLQDLLIGTVNSLATALDAKSPWTQGHSQRVSNVAVSLGKQLRLNDDELYNLRIASLFHDVGKIGTYDILLDKPDKLSDKEFALIKNHPVKTYEILVPIPRLEKIGKIAKHHHEKWDGSGYPDGLAGDNIPFFSRIITLADAYDAMSSDRPYRKKFSIDKIIDEIQNLSGSQFDPEIADVFISVIRKQPKEFRQKAKAA